jgi:hypothetical protein
MMKISILDTARVSSVATIINNKLSLGADIQPTLLVAYDVHYMHGRTLMTHQRNGGCLMSKIGILCMWCECNGGDRAI